MTKLPRSTALIVIDVQQAFLDPLWGERNDPEAEFKRGRPTPNEEGNGRLAGDLLRGL
jgi:hypothetical protein